MAEAGGFYISVCVYVCMYWGGGWGATDPLSALQLVLFVVEVPSYKRT